MTEQPPPPPPPPPALDEEREAVGGAPKKPWSKPTVQRVVDGVLWTGSGPKADPVGNIENMTYRPAS